MPGPDRPAVALSTRQFEALLTRLPGRGHAVPEVPAYVRDEPWTGACTRCGATAAAFALPRVRSKKRKREGSSGDPLAPRSAGRTRLDQAAPRPRARVDVRLLVPCRGAGGDRERGGWQPWMGRPYGG